MAFGKKPSPREYFSYVRALATQPVAILAQPVRQGWRTHACIAIALGFWLHTLVRTTPIMGRKQR